jgi:hypothetical protein
VQLRPYSATGTIRGEALLRNTDFCPLCFRRSSDEEATADDALIELAEAVVNREAEGEKAA